ncbi:MAG: hypothetical protein PHO01_12955, partial [Desulfotomaculaceae bacterium]|nr:hypothetical protein [Desulfotomaculaceae bacterium]
MIKLTHFISQLAITGFSCPMVDTLEPAFQDLFAGLVITLVSQTYGLFLGLGTAEQFNLLNHLEVFYRAVTCI